MPGVLRLLMIEDSADDAELALRELKRGGFDVRAERVETAEALASALQAHPWDIVLSDYSLPHLTAPEAIALFKKEDLDIPFVIVSGTVGEDVAVAALKLGAHDYIVKGNLTRLVPTVERELREKEDQRARRRAEEMLEKTRLQLLHAQKMEAVGRLASGVAHDFNNVLSVILSYAEMLVSGLKDGDPMRTDLGEIVKAGHRAADLTRQLLAFSRQQVLEPRAIDANHLLGEMERTIERLLGAGIEVTLLREPRLGRVWADPGQIERVIVNLVVNAGDAMPEGGKLTIETRNVELDQDYASQHHGVTPGSFVLLCVTDTGVGMDRETQTRVFEPFFTTKAPGKGTGLGLSTVFGIVEQSGGHVWVYSEPGVGSAFKVYLPRTDVELVSQSSPPPSQESFDGKETVLLVEDDEPVRSVVCGILRRRGYRVLEAPNAGEALLVCEGHPARIDLLMTDVVLPRMSGRQLAERLCALRPEMRVLFVSGYADEAVLQHGILESGVEFLQKPLTPDGVARKVREVLGPATGRHR